MSVVSSPALVQPVGNPYFEDPDRRCADRHPCTLEATSHPIEVGESLSWGAVVHDISVTGVGITLCYPFKPGTYLAVELQTTQGMIRAYMVRVVRVDDQTDGQWRLGCEFLKSLTHSEMELFI